MAGEGGVDVVELVEAELDACADCLPDPLGVVAQLPSPAAEPGRCRQLIDEEVAFSLDALGTGGVVVGLRLRQIGVEIGQAVAVGGERPAVKSRVVAPARDRAAGELADV